MGAPGVRAVLLNLTPASHGVLEPRAPGHIPVGSRSHRQPGSRPFPADKSPLSMIWKSLIGQSVLSASRDAAPGCLPCLSDITCDESCRWPGAGDVRGELSLCYLETCKYFTFFGRISLEIMTLQPRCEDVETAEGVALTVTGVAQVQ